MQSDESKPEQDFIRERRCWDGVNEDLLNQFRLSIFFCCSLYLFLYFALSRLSNIRDPDQHYVVFSKAKCRMFESQARLSKTGAHHCEHTASHMPFRRPVEYIFSLGRYSVPNTQSTKPTTKLWNTQLSHPPVPPDSKACDNKRSMTHAIRSRSWNVRNNGGNAGSNAQSHHES